MKTFDVDEYLKESGVKITIKGKEYVVKDFPADIPEDISNKDFLAEVIGCKKEDLDGYGTSTLLSIYNFLYENLIPENFRSPLLEGSKK